MLDYYLIGGYIKMPKNLFVREMLGKDSRLRPLLNWKTTKDFTKRHPLVSEADKDGIVTINFSSKAEVKVGESPEQLLGELKSRYKDKITGKVSCSAVYTLFGNVFFFDIDMDSNRDKIDYTMS